MPGAAPDPRTSHIVNVIGGLGNQLFQYLFGETLAHRTGTPAVYDTSAFRTYRLHTGFALEQAFGVSLPLLTRTDQHRRLVTRWPVLQKVARRSPAAARLLGCATDRTFSLDQASAAPGLFVGYWQSQAYEPSDLARFRARLRFDPALTDRVDTALAAIGPLETTGGVHVRRGDFVSAPATASHYALPAAYYRAAMSRLRDQGIERFVVASDDPAWVEQELAPHFPIVRPRGEGLNSAIADLCLLSRLPHKVLSNSTFSWWGAQLCAAPGRVIAPRQWSRPGRDLDWNRPRMAPDWALVDTIS